MREVLARQLAAPAAAVALALGGPAVAEASNGNGPQLGPALREECNTFDVHSGTIERCKTFVNGVLREMESDTVRDIVTQEPDGDIVHDHYALHRLTKYDFFGKRTLHYASSSLTREVNGQPVPVFAQLPASEQSQTS